MNQSTYILQIVNHEYGTRTEPFGSNLPDLAVLLRESEIPDSDYVLILANADDPKDQHAHRFPLITVKTFLAKQSENQPEVSNDVK